MMYPEVNLKEKTVMVIDFGNYIGVAIRLSKEFGRTYYHCPFVINGFPEHNPVDIGRNVPEIIKVQDFEDYIEEVDLFVFPDLYFKGLQRYLRRIGKLVYGSGDAQVMETDRGYMKMLQKELGLPTNEYEEVEGLYELEERLKLLEDKYIKSSLRGDSETFKHINYVLSKEELKGMKHRMGIFDKKEKYIIESKIESIAEVGIDTETADGKFLDISLTGIELKDVGFYGRMLSYNTLPKQIKDVTDKLSPIFENFGYRGPYSNEIRIDKKLDGYLIDQTCFSYDTEVLTDKGWKFFYELEGSEKVCTLNPNNRNIEYHVPYNFISYNYDGEMVSISNRKGTIECLVTPNHSVWRTDRNGNGLFEQRADSITDKGYIPRTGNWTEPDIDLFELPEYHHEWDFNSSRCGGYTVCRKIKHVEAKQIKMDHWVAFMAWYLTEGSMGGYKKEDGIPNNICISQKKYVQEIAKVLDDCGFKYKYTSGIGFQISSIQLSSYLKKYGLCDKKYIPEYIKNCSKRQIRIFLDNFLLADGDSVTKRKYFTTSKTMADDIQELLLKVGTVGNISFKKLRGTILSIKGKKEYLRKHDAYIVSEYHNNFNFWFETGSRGQNYINKEKYIGLVYDVTVENHILYVRRNGKPFWSGNCRMPSPPTSLKMLMYDNYGEILWTIACGEIPKVKYRFTHGVQFIIKSELGKTEPVAIQFPEEFIDNIDIKNLVIDDDGTYYYTPNGVAMAEIGSVSAVGHSMEQAVKKATEIAEQVKGFDICINTDCIEDAKNQIKELNKNGIRYL